MFTFLHDVQIISEPDALYGRKITWNGRRSCFGNIYVRIVNISLTRRGERRNSSRRSATKESRSQGGTKMNRRTCVSAAVIVCLLAVAIPGIAQTALGTLRGVVRDQQGGALP